MRSCERTRWRGVCRLDRGGVFKIPRIGTLNKRRSRRQARYKTKTQQRVGSKVEKLIFSRTGCGDADSCRRIMECGDIRYFYERGCFLVDATTNFVETITNFIDGGTAAESRRDAIADNLFHQKRCSVSSIPRLPISIRCPRTSAMPDVCAKNGDTGEFGSRRSSHGERPQSHGLKVSAAGESPISPLT